MIGVIKEFKEVDGKHKTFISRVNHVMSMLVNLSLGILYGSKSLVLLRYVQEGNGSRLLYTEHRGLL